MNINADGVGANGAAGRFADQVAIVTGGGQGIGYAVADHLARDGATVVIWDIDGERAEAAAERLSGGHGEGRAHALAVDIGDSASVKRGAEHTLTIRGRIDVMICNAGIVGPNHPVTEYPEDAWTAVVHTNINGTFFCCKHVIPLMAERGYGRVVCIASIAGKEGNPNAGAYSASKAGVIALTKTLGKEWAGKDIGVNCVTPAVAGTPGAMEQAPEHIEYMLSKIPRGRFLELPEAASMICWAASSENSFTTGAVFDLSGGRATY